MALPSSGSLSLSQIAAEFGDTPPYSMSEYYRGGSLVNDVASNINVPTSGQVSLSNFYGAQALLIFNAEYIVVAGGGGRTSSGGGGAGGYRSSISGEQTGGGASLESPIELLGGVTYTVTVGAGNVGQGGNSTFHTITSIGGGTSGGSGGSGGGGNPQQGGAGSGTSGQGYSGGAQPARRPICQFIPSHVVCLYQDGGGGGGAAQAGNPGVSNSSDGKGGDGIYSPLLGYYLAGGGQGNGGTGGDGLGGGNTANRGGGGGNQVYGGSGVVVIKVPSSLPNATTVGTVSTFTSGSSKVYVFTSSGTITW